jgi:hypothetical protein
VTTRGFRKVVLVAVLSCAGLAGCESRPAQVHFVLPTGYHGAFAVKPHEPAGIELQKTNGRYVINIPVEGVLRIKGNGPFGSHLETASFATGDEIWVSKHIDDKPSRREVALWGGGTYIWDVDGQPTSFYWWFVGTEEEWKDSGEESVEKVRGVAEKGRR